VGGDFHAVHRLQSGGLEVVVGVVLGEGFAATLLGAACLDHVSRAAASVDGPRPLGAILTQANRTLSPELIRQSTLAKTALVRVDGDPLCLTIADAGHGNIAIRSLDGTVFEPRGRETLLGLEHRPFRESSIVLSHGDLVLVFTQGLSRITSALGVGFDVAEWLGETKAETPVELLDALSKEIERGTGAADGSEDDITCIAIGVNGPREGN
jgi:serine phosphatase RsbU (regulator of sigma subunit)